MEKTTLDDIEYTEKILNNNLAKISEIKTSVAQADGKVNLPFSFDGQGNLKEYDPKGDLGVSVVFGVDNGSTVTGVQSIKFFGKGRQLEENHNAELLGDEIVVVYSLLKYAGVKPDTISNVEIVIGDAKLSDERKEELKS